MENPIFEIPNLAFPIKLEQASNKRFRIIYGKEVKYASTYEKAANELGHCIMHALACDGKIKC